jgi:hypothetical protein
MLMNTNLIKRFLIGSILAVAVVLAPSSGQAQDKSGKGGATLLLKPIKTAQDINALKSGDAVVMSCPKCKTVTVTYVELTKGHIKEQKARQAHLCPGCQTTIETQGAGKAIKDEVVHVCKKCGSEDVMCCVLKKGDETKGMEEQKKK